MDSEPDKKDAYIDLTEDYRCSACGILLSSEHAGDHDGEYCEKHKSYPHDEN